ncbi:UDENN domain-containing protein [Mycena kentingensis (nom. inval.)]|nr:UDENN domain-containing protein [Mycena kentingensis (nom. inval.)]
MPGLPIPQARARALSSLSPGRVDGDADAQLWLSLTACSCPWFVRPSGWCVAVGGSLGGPRCDVVSRIPVALVFVWSRRPRKSRDPSSTYKSPTDSCHYHPFQCACYREAYHLRWAQETRRGGVLLRSVRLRAGGCGAVLRGFIERAFQYTNLENKEEWEAVPAYIAGHLQIVPDLGPASRHLGGRDDRGEGHMHHLPSPVGSAAEWRSGSAASGDVQYGSQSE